jgi:lipid A 3-O-deacylase
MTLMRGFEVSTPMRRFCWIVGLAGGCLPVRSWAQHAPQPAPQAASAEPAPQAPSSTAFARPLPGFEADEPPRRLRRHTRQFGSALAVGFGTYEFGGKERHDLALASIRFGQALGRPVDGDPWREGHLELIGEVWGGTQTSRQRRSLVGLTPLVRYNFAARGRWVPFGEAGAGVAYTTIAGRDLSNGFQVNLQAGVGTHYFLREDLALTLQYRWFHLSNAGLNRPNTGLNSLVVFAGISRFY